MGSFKIIATLAWEIEGESDSAEFVKEQIQSMIDDSEWSSLEGFDFNFSIVKMKTRKRLIHLGEFEPDEVLVFTSRDNVRKEFNIDGKSYSVRMNSDRYAVFQDSLFCISCGLEGTKMILDMNEGDTNPHFNLYAEEDGDLVLMTKDHIIPKSKGGKNDISNYASMCCICNNIKGNYELSYEQVAELRKLYKNDQKLPKKEFKRFINSIRNKMLAENSV